MNMHRYTPFFEARGLTANQKKMLDKYFDSTGSVDITDNEGFEKQLTQMNDYETLWQDANRYLTDKHFSKQYGR